MILAVVFVAAVAVLIAAAAVSLVRRRHGVLDVEDPHALASAERASIKPPRGGTKLVGQDWG